MSDATPDSSCRLLAGGFAYLVQFGLFATAIATLLYKRHIEKPRREWVVWGFDAAKQGFAGAAQHGVNLLFGVVFGKHSEASECALVTRAADAGLTELTIGAAARAGEHFG